MDIQQIIMVLVAILFSMTLHEAMHGYMSYFLGDDTAKAQGRLTLNPLKHIDPFLTIILPLLLLISRGPIFGGAKPVPFNPNNVRGGDMGVALVALSGPLLNLLLAFISSGILSFLPDTGLPGEFFHTMVMVNLGFFAFNILPIPPLDGSRVLYAIAPEFVQKGMQQIERYGLFLIFWIVLIGGPFLSKILVAIITFFLNIFAAIFQVL